MDERCRTHERWLERLELKQDEMLKRQGRADGKLDLLCNHLLPPSKRPDSNPPAGIVQLKTKWGTIKGSAPWIALLATLGAALWVVERLIN